MTRRRTLLLILMVMALAAGLLNACTPPFVATPTPSPQVPAAGLAAPRVPTTSNSSEVALSGLVEAARKEGKVTLYGVYFLGDVATALAQAFERRYGIKVETIASTGVVLIERIKTETKAKQYIADSLAQTVVMIQIAKNEGITQPWGDLPILSERGVWRMNPSPDPDGHALVALPSYLPPYINTTMVRAEEEPRSYKDFLHPRWMGRISVADGRTNIVLNAALALKVVDEDFLRGLGKQRIKISATTQDSKNQLMRGEVAAWVIGSDTTMNPVILEGAPVKPLDMDEGTIIMGGVTTALLRNAPHPNATRLFWNWVLSQEGQTVWSKTVGQLPLRTDVPDFTPQLARIKPKRAVEMTSEKVIEAARMQAEGTINKLLGVE